MKELIWASAVAGAGMLTVGAHAVPVEIGGGQTNVLLDTDTLSTLAGLTLNSVSADVVAPGNLGPDSVAFGINPRDGSLPTTLSYDTTDFLGTAAGTIEHAGSVFFDSALGLVEVGDFTIGFDAGRVGGPSGTASGFFVESTTGIEAILFDIEDPSSLVAAEESLVIEANLLVSPEFGLFLFDNDLSSSNLEGADVGDALVQGVPAPGTALALAGLLAARRRRRSRD